MISYKLKCTEEHEFEGWFKDSANFDNQRDDKQISCPYCNSTDIRKSLSAPNISTSRKQENAQTELATQAFKAIQQMRDTVEKNCDDVGENFAEEARKIHYGESTERGIYGKASTEESQALVDEGIKVLPLPWMEEEKKN